MQALGKGADIPGSVLLSWHEKVSDHDIASYANPTQLTEAAGVGCIVRVMTDRRLL